MSWRMKARHATGVVTTIFVPSMTSRAFDFNRCLSALIRRKKMPELLC